jgi:hypothetical protein|tara:strand:+ start:925 stop:1941 length:1017 start_codon:yes stop_codon:yes gene_type:complete
MKSYYFLLKRILHPSLIIFILIGLTGFLIGVITGVKSRIPVLESSLMITRDRVKALEINIHGLNENLSNSLKSQKILRKILDKERIEVEKEVLYSKQIIKTLHEDLLKSTTKSKLEQNKISLITEQMRQLKNNLSALSQELEISESKRKLTQNKLENELVTLSIKLSETMSQNVKIEDNVKLERLVARNKSLELNKIISKLRSDLQKYKQTAYMIKSENISNNEVAVVLSKSSPLLIGPIRQGIEAYKRSDYIKAYELWLPLALDGSKRAQFFIGALYFEGRGVKQNIIRSYLWLHAANESGDKAAPGLITKVKKTMTPSELNEVQRRIMTKYSLPIK